MATRQVAARLSGVDPEAGAELAPFDPPSALEAPEIEGARGSGSVTCVGNVMQGP